MNAFRYLKIFKYRGEQLEIFQLLFDRFWFTNYYNSKIHNAQEKMLDLKINVKVLLEKLQQWFFCIKKNTNSFAISTSSTFLLREIRIFFEFDCIDEEQQALKFWQLSRIWYQII